MSALEKYRGLAHLLGVAVVLPLLAWRLALADTAGKWREARRTEKQLTALRTQDAAPAAPLLVVGEHIRDGELLGEILCGPGCCEVVKYTPYVANAADGLAIHTAEVVLNTDCLSFVRIVDHIERTMPASRLRSVSLRAMVPRGSTRPQLYGMLIIQQIAETK